MADESVEIGERKFVSEKEAKKEEEKTPGVMKKEKSRHESGRGEKKKEKKKEWDIRKSETEKEPDGAKHIRENEQKTRRIERGKFIQAAEQSMESSTAHDMKEQALGRMAGIQGGLDYDELHRMASNGIRDADELVEESLGNHGFDENVEKIQRMMEGYVHEGKPDINAIAKLEKQYDAGEIAQAFVNTASGCSVKDVRWLERIDDVCGFNAPAYEQEFDLIRRYDRDADAVMERLEVEFGRERM